MHKIAKSIVLLSTAVFLSVVGVANLPSRPFYFSFHYERLIKLIIPQYWGFFTKSPRGYETAIYFWKGEKLVKFDLIGNRLKTIFGLQRKKMLYTIEVGFLTARIDPSTWNDCSRSINECLNESRQKVRLTNLTNTKLLCGELVFEKYKLNPWAYSSFARKEKNKQYVQVNVDCEG